MDPTVWFQWFLHRRFFRFSFFSGFHWIHWYFAVPPSAPSHCWKVPSPDRHQALCAPRCSPLGPLRYFSSAGDRFADMGCSGHCLECGKDGPKLGGSCWIFDSVQIDQSVREKKNMFFGTQFRGSPIHRPRGDQKQLRTASVGPDGSSMDSHVQPLQPLTLKNLQFLLSFHMFPYVSICFHIVFPYVSIIPKDFKVTSHHGSPSVHVRPPRPCLLPGDAAIS